MRTIDADLKSRQFKHIYLLYGTESYLIRQYKQMLVQALVPNGDTMNFNRFTDKDFSEEAVIEAANTMPFFADYRVILVEGTGCFQRKSERLPELVENLPDNVYLIFAEGEVRENLALFRRVAKYGDAEKLGMPQEKELQRWLGRRIRQAGLNITKSAWAQFRSSTGGSMDNMSNEMDKLIAYCHGKEVIEREDVAAICTVQIEEKIFEMIDGIAEHDPAKVLDRYRGLLHFRAAPKQILATMHTQFERILVIKEMAFRRKSDLEIAQALHTGDFVVRKNRPMTRSFSVEELTELLSDIDDLDAQIVTGRMDAQIGLETLMMKYAAEIA